MWVSYCSNSSMQVSVSCKNSIQNIPVSSFIVLRYWPVQRTCEPVLQTCCKCVFVIINFSTHPLGHIWTWATAQEILLLCSSTFLFYQWTMVSRFYLCNIQSTIILDLDLAFLPTIKPWCIKKSNCILAIVETHIAVNYFFNYLSSVDVTKLINFSRRSKS